MEKGLNEKLTETNHKLDGFFELEKIKYTEKITDENKENSKEHNKTKTKKVKIESEVEKDTVYCTKVEDLVSLVIEERKLQADNTEIQIGMDDGQGLLKVHTNKSPFICLSMIMRFNLNF